jgi:hypothetical protein
MHIVTVIQVEALLSAEPITQATQLDGVGTLMADERIWSLLTRCLGPELKVIWVQAPHLQVFQR